jgi:Flp pilus assembly secretin CpaC
MFPTHLVQAAVFGLIWTLGASFAQAQPVTPEAQPITVLVGQATVELFDSPISVTAADHDVIDVSKPQGTVGTQKLYSISGKKLGKTTLVVVGSPPAQPKVYNVLVIRDPAKRAELEAFIATSFPGSKVSLKASPDTAALIVEGWVSDQWTAVQVIRLIEDSGYSPREIIDRLSYCCVSSSCCWTCGRHCHRFGY